MKHRVLIVDDEHAIRFGVRDYLESQGYLVEEADSCAKAIAAFQHARPDAVVLDFRLPDGTALDLLPQLRRVDASVPIVVLTAHGSIDLAVNAIKEGAEQFLTKPVELPALQLILDRLVEHQRNRQRQMAHRSQRERDVADPFIGTHPSIRRLGTFAGKVGQSETPVLITGETGTGKGVLAQWLHENGPRRDDAFVDLNCAGLSAELLDSELFGHERGAFTSAVKEKVGLLEVAHRGTLFLDEIGDMDLQVQAKLLKVLEEQRFRRLGSVRDRLVDVRLIAATHHNLEDLVTEGRFRHDLYFRINTIALRLPSLRDRGEDVLVIARSLLRRLASDLGRTSVALRPDAEQALVEYEWPGNLRELRNVLERALLLADGDVLTREDLHFQDRRTRIGTMPAMAQTLREVEIQHIDRVLREVGGRVQLAAEQLDIPKSSLYQKLKAYQLDAAQYRPIAQRVG